MAVEQAGQVGRKRKKIWLIRQNGERSMNQAVSSCRHSRFESECDSNAFRYRLLLLTQVLTATKEEEKTRNKKTQAPPIKPINRPHQPPAWAPACSSRSVVFKCPKSTALKRAVCPKRVLTCRLCCSFGPFLPMPYVVLGFGLVVVFLFLFLFLVLFVCFALAPACLLIVGVCFCAVLSCLLVSALCSVRKASAFGHRTLTTSLGFCGLELRHRKTIGRLLGTRPFSQKSNPFRVPHAACVPGCCCCFLFFLGGVSQVVSCCLGSWWAFVFLSSPNSRKLWGLCPDQRSFLAAAFRKIPEEFRLGVCLLGQPRDLTGNLSRFLTALEVLNREMTLARKSPPGPPGDP